MANVGVKGSIANTALRNTFNGLLGGVTLTGKAFGEYEYTAIKANGSMKSLGDTINELRGYFEQMTESERVLNAQEIAGERGYNGLLGVPMASEESYENLTEKINNCEGAASRMAKIKMDNLHGDILLAESAWEGFQIAVGERATPAMRMFYQVQADVLSGMGELVDAHPALAQGIMTTTGLFLGATTAVTGLSAAIKVFKALDVASLSEGLAQMNTDFQGELDQILEYTQSTIAAMNLSEEARQSAEATMQAFAKAAKDQMPIVQSAFNAVAAGAMDSFNRALSNRPSISGTLNVGLANVKGSFEAIGGFASGTPNAPPGWAWVGEEGPELMYLHGGETILPAETSAKMANIPWYASGTSNAERGPALVGENGPELYTEPKPLYTFDGSSGQNGGGATYNITLNHSPTYNIGDSSNKDALIDLFNNLTVEQAEKLAELILDVLADHERNKALEDF